ncbi:hypothetical protein C496_19530 [Natronorubrum tibetense GA33]|uniref:Uncharacterized protein n=1 Tax=Natronorubrum tibetense GA33 TaxID=1114856 RepID=L9VL88_9EURY|nr:hypothetical protein C496_19530 [Natronorubrum tibetense GA33]
MNRYSSHVRLTMETRVTTEMKMVEVQHTRRMHGEQSPTLVRSVVRMVILQQQYQRQVAIQEKLDSNSQHSQLETVINSESLLQDALEHAGKHIF